MKKYKQHKKSLGRKLNNLVNITLFASMIATYFFGVITSDYRAYDLHGEKTEVLMASMKHSVQNNLNNINTLLENISKEDSNYIKNSIDNYVSIDISKIDLQKYKLNEINNVYLIEKSTIIHQLNTSNKNINNQYIEFCKNINVNNQLIWSENYIDNELIYAGIKISDDITIIIDININTLTNITDIDLGDGNFFAIVKKDDNNSYNIISTSGSGEISEMEKVVSDNLNNKLINNENTPLEKHEKQLIIKYDNKYKMYYLAGIDSSKFFKSMMKSITLVTASVIATIIFVKIYTKIRIIKIIKNLLSINKSIDIMSKGDLRNQIDISICNNKDEIGEIAKNTSYMIENYNSLIGNLKDTSSKLLNISKDLNKSANITENDSMQINNTMDITIQGTLEQLSYINTCSNDFNEFNKKLEHTAKMSEDMMNLSLDINSRSIEGLTITEQLKSTNDDNRSKIKQALYIIGELHKKTTNINSIVETMTKISEKINVLALNTSIEASKDGTSGRVFDIVAIEVKKLANQSFESTKEISLIIDEIKTDIEESLKCIEDINNSSVNQSSVVDKTNDTFEYMINSLQSITKSTQNVNNLIDEINTKKDNIGLSIDKIANISSEISNLCTDTKTTMDKQLSSVVNLNEFAKEINERANILADDTNKFTI